MGTRAVLVELDDTVAKHLEEAVPTDERNAFVERAIREQLAVLDREQFEREMEECGRVMYDEILALEEDFRPLEEEVHRLT
jgi:hypothetical protein